MTESERALAPLLFLWGIGWWLLAGFGELDRVVTRDYWPGAALAFVTVTVFVSSVAHFRLAWREAAWPQLVLLPVIFALVGFAAINNGHAFANLGWLMVPLALAAHLLLLRNHQPEPSAAGHAYFSLLHTMTALLIAAIGAVELHWLAVDVGLGKSAWSVAALMLVPCGLILWAASEPARSRWPVRDFGNAYWLHAALPLMLVLAVWSVGANFWHDAKSAPLPYLPLLNAIDLAHLFLGMTCIVWWRRVEDDVEIAGYKTLFRVFVSGLAFIWVNAILLRTLHHWMDIPYQWTPLMRSVLVQAALSLFWTVLALALMLFAVRKASRAVWMVGAGLMAVVVGKLLFVDLSHLSGVERIVSFMGVGILMLVIGYVAPVPPKQKSDDASSMEEAKS